MAFPGRPFQGPRKASLFIRTSNRDSVDSTGYRNRTEEMSFIHVLRNVRLERHTFLCAEGLSRSGDWQHTELDLDERLGNTLGKFDWSGSRFGDSARSIELQESMLIARLDTPTITRGWTEAAVDLSKHIVARDFRLTFVGSEERYRSGTSGVDSGSNNVGDTSSSARSKKPGNGEQEERDSRIPQRTQCSLATEAFTYDPLPTPTLIRLLRLYTAHSLTLGWTGEVAYGATGWPDYKPTLMVPPSNES